MYQFDWAAKIRRSTGILPVTPMPMGPGPCSMALNLDDAYRLVASSGRSVYLRAFTTWAFRPSYEPLGWKPKPRPNRRATGILPIKLIRYRTDGNAKQ